MGMVASEPTVSFPEPRYEFPEGTPSITGRFKGAKPGQATSRHRPTVRIHGPGESTGCITTEQCGSIQDMMDRNSNIGGMSLDIKDVCCKQGEGPPDPMPRAIPL